jgi:hypothetical protein
VTIAGRSTLVAVVKAFDVVVDATSTKLHIGVTE